MALRGASTSTNDTDWADWQVLGKEGAAALFTVLKIEDEQDYGNGPFQPIRARVVILTGAQAGAVYPDERVMPKGIRDKLTEVGDEVVGRLSTYTRGRKQHPCLNNEEDGDIELAQAALAKFNGSSSSKAPARSKAKTVEADDSEPPF